MLADTAIVHDLSGVDLRAADFSNQIIEGQDLSDADLEGSDFSGADLYWTYMFRANCRGCDFRRCRLSGVVLDGANLRDADLTGAYISYDQVGGSSSILGANLMGAKYEDVILLGCEYNGDTRLPVGLDPDAAGMVLVAK